MTYLTFNGVVRGESDAEAIATLTRKGWTQTDAPSAPQPSARETARAALRATWGQQPSWIRGPFDAHFRQAQLFLDAGDDDAARDLISFAEPPGAYTSEQLSTFAQLKTDIAAAIAALPSL